MGYQQRLSCFATATTADLVWQGLKVVGSAQLWQQGVVLQHGTILLAPDRDQWDKVLPGSGLRLKGVWEIAPPDLSGDPLADLRDTLTSAAAQCLDCDWMIQDWTMAEQDEILRLMPQFGIEDFPLLPMQNVPTLNEQPIPTAHLE
jgi:lipoate-protein ligase A